MDAACDLAVGARRSRRRTAWRRARLMRGAAWPGMEMANAVVSSPRLSPSCLAGRCTQHIASLQLVGVPAPTSEPPNAIANAPRMTYKHRQVASIEAKDEHLNVRECDCLTLHGCALRQHQQRLDPCRHKEQ